MLAAAYALLLLSCLKDVGNPDVFWHLRAGERILEARSVPRADWLTFTRPGAPWLDFEWLQQALWALLYRAGGFWALILLKTALLCGAAAVVERSLARRGLDGRVRACAVALLAAGFATVNDLRADTLSLLLLAATLGGLEALRGRRGTAAAGELFALAAAGFAGGSAWANAHGAFALGLACAAAYAALGTGALRARAGALLAGALAGTLLTPFGPGLYHVLWEHARQEREMARLIVEWHWSSPDRLAVWPFWLCAAGAAWTLSAVPRRREEAPLWAVLAGLLLLGTRHQRDTPYFVTAAALLLPPLLARAKRAETPRAAAPAFVLAAAALIAALPQGASRSGLLPGKFPEGAARYLAAHPDVAAKKLYNPWGWGGFLEWRLRGTPYRAFFDGRYLFHDLLARSVAATSDPRAWNAFLDEQGLDGALLERGQPDMRVRVEGFDGKVREGTFPYEVLFMPRERWRLLYEDERSALYVRR